MSNTDVRPDPKETPPQIRKRWYRRKRFWILTPFILLLVAVAGLGLVSFTHAKSRALLTRLGMTAVIQSADTPGTERIEAALFTLCEIPGFETWIMEPLLEAGGYSLLTMMLDLKVELPQPNSGVTLTAEEFRLLTTHRNIIAFDAVNEELTLEQLQDLSRMTWLTELSINLTHFEEQGQTDQIFAALDKMCRLKSIKLNVDHASPALARWLRKQSQLQNLDLGYQSLDLEVMQAIATLKNIRELTLYGSFPANTSSQLIVKHFEPGKNSGLPHFDKLRITAGSLPGTEEIVHQLLQNPSLTEVQLCQLDLTDRLVADIVALKSLTALGLSRQEVKTKDLRAMTALPKLKSLTMQFSQLEEDSIDVLNDCQKLQMIDLRWAKIPPAILAKLHSRPDLNVQTGDDQVQVNTIVNEPQEAVVEK